MCGIVGYLEPPGLRSREDCLTRLQRMRDRLEHRGPDDRGSWLDENVCVGLGHRRLSILDLSPLGHQPMSSCNGRYQIVYNGEIYNYLELQEQLRALGHTFRGSSDTEVLLAALCQWGAEATLGLLNGMFAIALWDRQERKLLLARDRYGKKPLYYGRVGSTWVFASELKAICAEREFAVTLSRDSLALYLRYGYVPAPFTIYQELSKLTPGCYLWLGESSAPQPYPAWEPSETSLETALQKAVRRRMLSDVPIGAFLSGGIDSSLVVALMQEQSTQPIRTFTLGFQESGFDEAVFARKIANHLGTDHCEHYVSADEAISVVPELHQVYDEPFADSSQIPTLLISRLTRKQVAVALTGDGGDELFGGYNRHLWAPKVWSLLGLVPYPLRQWLHRLLALIPFSLLAKLFGQRWRYPQEKLTKLNDLVPLRGPEELYKALVSPWRHPEQIVKFGREPLTLLDRCPMQGQFAEWMMRMDSLTYLPDDILVKVDRASMACGLETRCPLLDPEVSQLAWALPLDEKIKAGLSKVPLRREVYKRVPRELLERPKAGFALPVGPWLRGPLRGWSEELLAQVPSQDFFRSEPILRRWKEHQSGSRDWSASLWTVLIFQDWLRHHDSCSL